MARLLPDPELDRVHAGGAAQPPASASRLEAERPIDSSTGTMPLLDDAEMIAKVRRGDSRAATALYERARPTVRRMVCRLLGRSDAEHDDVVQTAMIAIVDSIHRFRGESSLDTWFARITANTVWRVFRRRTSERRLLDTRREPSMVESAQEGYEARELLARVRDVLNSMDPVKAYPVLLFDVCGYDLKEVAEITQSSIAAAQTRLVRGRAELHERIERDPELAELLARRERR